MKVVVLAEKPSVGKEIARVLDKDVKSVDNALQRIKKKVEKFLNDNKYKQ